MLVIFSHRSGCWQDATEMDRLTHADGQFVDGAEHQANGRSLGDTRFRVASESMSRDMRSIILNR